MSFPSEKDITRLLNVQGADSGFFVLAVYAFIETYIKSELNDFSNDSAADEYDSRFKQLLINFRNMLKIKYGYLPPNDLNFLLDLRKGKNAANDVRHKFLELNVEDERSAISDLIHFFDIADVQIKEKLAALNENLSEWEKRTTPAETADALLKANRQLEEFQKNLPQMIVQSDEYKSLQSRLEEIIRKCNALEKEKNETEEASKQIEAELKNYENTRNELNEKFGKYEEYISNLKRMLNYTRTRNDFEHSILRLTAEQEDAVNRIKFKKDYLVKGSAGTGKSLVLLKSIEKLLSENKTSTPPKILFVTFTKSLVNYNAYVAKLMNMGIERENIKTADNLFREIFEKMIPGHYIDYCSYENIVEKIIKNDYPDSGLSAKDIWIEATRFIWPMLISKEEYLDKMIEREGLKTSLKKSQRKIYWEIISKAESEIEALKKWNAEYAQYRLAKMISENDGEKSGSEKDKIADYIFIDEAQDLTIASLSVLKTSCTSSVIMAADNDQMLYQVAVPYSRSGINILGTSVTLKTNFRNTVQINDVAEKYRKLIKGCGKDSKPSSFRLGPPVELIDVEKEKVSSGDFLKLAAKRVKFCIDELNYAPENICVIMSYTGHGRMESMMKALGELKIPAEEIKNKDFEQSGKVCVSTIQSVKGLDFPVVILLAEHRFHLNDDIYDEETNEKTQRNLFYVALTRAMDMLTVFTWDNSDNDVINDLKKCISE